MPVQNKLRILCLVYPHFDTLDMNGPLEVFCGTSYPGGESPFTVTIAAAEDLIVAGTGYLVQRNISFTDALATISSFSVLLVPGAQVKDILPYLKEGETRFSEMLNVAEAFCKLGPREDGTERVMLTVCTGALAPAYRGLFDGLRVTTHYWAYDVLESLCAGYKERNPGVAKGATIVGPVSGKEPRVRWVDAGKNAHGVRVISAGGVSCGIDATLFLASERYGRETALALAEVMEYAWRENV